MNKTKTITMTGLLTALAVIIPMIMPIKIAIPPFTATLASHLPLILSMFLGPIPAIIVALGSGIGFLLTPFGPIVAARAALHVLFTFTGAMMIRKNINYYLVLVVTLVVHTLSDMAIVYALAEVFGFSITGTNTMKYVQYIIAVGTSAHHVVDYILATIVAIPLSKTMPDSFNKSSLDFSFKSKKRPAQNY